MFVLKSFSLFNFLDNLWQVVLLSSLLGALGVLLYLVFILAGNHHELGLSFSQDSFLIIESYKELPILLFFFTLANRAVKIHIFKVIFECIDLVICQLVRQKEDEVVSKIDMIVWIRRYAHPFFGV